MRTSSSGSFPELWKTSGSSTSTKTGCICTGVGQASASTKCEYMIAEASVNRDPNQYTGADTAHDARLLVFLIDRLLLGKDVPFPTRDARSSDLDDAIKMWHTVGRGRANDEEVIY